MTIEIADRAGELARRYLRSHAGVDTVDYLLAATAQILKGELLTTNVRHFPMFRGSCQLTDNDRIRSKTRDSHRASSLGYPARMGFTFELVEYRTLNARQQEAFNFQKVSAVLADYGFVTMRLSSDWQGADFIAQHRDGTFLKVQLKSRLTFSTKYENRDLYVCFPDAGDWFIYPHDELLKQVHESTEMGLSASWRDGNYTYSRLSRAMRKRLEPYRLRAQKALGVPRD